MIKLNKRQTKNYWNKVIKTESCWIWKASKNSCGYGQFDVNGKLKQTHRISYELYYGWIQDSLHVLHTCDNPACVNPEHLWQGTQKQNMKDKVSKNRQAKGEKQGIAKLTEQQIIEIRAKYIPWKYTLKILAEEYNVSLPLIFYIVNNKRWKHI